MQLKDLHDFRGGLNTDDNPANLPPSDYPDALNVRTGGSDQQHGEGPAETLQSEIEILINPDSAITYYGSAIGGQFVYSGFLECKIGNQVWMKKNWDANYPGSKVYNDDENNRDVFGGLYTHDQILASDFCPEGWHVPTEAEVTTLILNLLGAAVAGDKLKDIGWWDDPHTVATDSSGFKAMPGGGFGMDIISPYFSYSDWFLPSKDELNAMYTELHLHGIGGFYDIMGDYSNTLYLTSSETTHPSESIIWVQSFGDGVQYGNIFKNESNRFRPCRAFTSTTVYNLRDIGPAGGLIFWKSGNDYLEAALNDLIPSDWSNVISGFAGTGTLIGTGQANTTAIINQVGHTASAAKLCNDLIIDNSLYYGAAIGSDLVYDLLGSTGLLWLADEAPDGIIDIDGNEYHTVIIGNQEWLVENLKTTKYADGSVVPNLNVNGDWAADVIGAYCWYNNDIINKDYGALYDWYGINNAHGLAADGQFQQLGIASNGWRVGTRTDYNTLIAALGGTGVAGGKLKEMGLIHWNTPNTGASDEIGFKAVGGGMRNTVGTFSGINTLSSYWTTPQSAGTTAYTRDIQSTLISCIENNNNKHNGFSVRCMRDI